MKVKKLLCCLLALTLICSLCVGMTPVSAASKKTKGVTCTAEDGAKLNKAISTSADVYKASTATLLAKGMGAKGYIKITANEDGTLILNPQNGSSTNICVDVYSNNKFSNYPLGIGSGVFSSGKWVQAKQLLGDSKHIIALPMAAGNTYYLKCVGVSKKLTDETIDIKAGFVPNSKQYVAVGTPYESVDYIFHMPLTLAKDMPKNNPNDHFTLDYDKYNMAWRNTLTEPDHSFTSDGLKRMGVYFDKEATSRSGSCYNLTFDIDPIGFKNLDFITFYVGYEYKGVWGAFRLDTDMRKFNPKYDGYLIDEPISALAGTNVIVGQAKPFNIVCVNYNGKEYREIANEDGYYAVKLKSNLQKNKTFSIYYMEMEFKARTFDVKEAFAQNLAE